MTGSAGIVDATGSDFRDLVAEGTVLVDVWGPQCQPCKVLLPHVEALAEKYADDMRVIKVEAPKARRLCMELGIMGLPAFLLFRNGEEVGRLSDPSLSPEALKTWLDEQRKEVN